MSKRTESRPLDAVIDAVQRGFETQQRALSALEARIDRIHTDVQRSAEMATRLKLATDNAKSLARLHNETLAAIEARLTEIEARLQGATSAPDAGARKRSARPVDRKRARPHA